MFIRPLILSASGCGLKSAKFISHFYLLLLRRSQFICQVFILQIKDFLNVFVVFEHPSCLLCEIVLLWDWANCQNSLFSLHSSFSSHFSLFSSPFFFRFSSAFLFSRLLNWVDGSRNYPLYLFNFFFSHSFINIVK